MEDKVRSFYAKAFPDNPEACRVFFAPGRLNILGDHTTHAGGILISSTFAKGTWVAAAKGQGGLIRMYSANDKAGLSLAALPPETSPAWVNRSAGLLFELAKEVPSFPGLDILFLSETPSGIGLSRMASWENAALFAFEKIFELAFDKDKVLGFADIVRSSQTKKPVETLNHPWRLERENYLGIRYAKAEELHLVDPDLARERPVPITGSGYRFAIFDSQVRGPETDPVLLDRIECCRKAIRKIQTMFPKVKRIVDLTPDELEASYSILDDVEKKRVTHVVSENQRVRQGVQKLKNKEYFSFGRLMYDSHASLKNDYNVSARELDTAVSFAKGIPAIIGARMTGPGLGGALVLLLDRQGENETLAKLCASYEKETGKKPVLYPLDPPGGPRELGVETAPAPATEESPAEVPAPSVNES